MYTHRDTRTHTETHVHTQRHTYTHRDTRTHTETHVHTQTHTYTHTHTRTDIHMYIHTDTCTIVHAYTDTYKQYTYVHTPIKSCNTLLFTHRSGYCTQGGGREHSTHFLLCFHCTQLLSSLMAPSVNDRSGLSSKPAQQDGPGGHTCPHHNFHSPLASKRVEI
ncbi:unnamed protein product [Staurois parvus]|uniref:Uncharacterized protein n=1 Tax=Staurois parvus TaxID=386267 RepID=A0ABN9BTG9_9NEOB|nr:unnamed protein product [Staurois parvus]